MNSLRQLLILTISLTLVFEPLVVAGNRQSLYRCITETGDHFVSFDIGCEGRRTEAFMGYIDARRTEQATVPIYRCVTQDLRDHFTTSDATCRGHIVEGLLGYVSSTDPRLLGVAALPFYECLTLPGLINSHFVSHLINCEGQRTLSQHGYLLQSP